MTCRLEGPLLDKIGRFQSGPFAEAFRGASQENVALPWSQLHWLYLRARAAHFGAMTQYQEPVRQMMWALDILSSSHHLVWFGILCEDNRTFDEVLRCYEHVRSQGVGYLHCLWEHLQLPVEVPSSQLSAIFQPRLEGCAHPLRSVTDYTRRMEQIRPSNSETDTSLGLHDAFERPPSVPSIVYAWAPASGTSQEKS